MLPESVYIERVVVPRPGHSPFSTDSFDTQPQFIGSIRIILFIDSVHIQDMMRRPDYVRWFSVSKCKKLTCFFRQLQTVPILQPPKHFKRVHRSCHYPEHSCPCLYPARHRQGCLARGQSRQGRTQTRQLRLRGHPRPLHRQISPVW